MPPAYRRFPVRSGRQLFQKQKTWKYKAGHKSGILACRISDFDFRRRHIAFADARWALSVKTGAAVRADSAAGDVS
jgi:hypothetical protein